MYEVLAVLYERAHEYQNFVQNPDVKVLTTIAAIAAHHGKNYSFPSQEKIVERLAASGRRMSRRTLNRHLNQMVRDGWITRRRRHTHCPHRGMTFRSTLYELTKRGFKFLAALAPAVGRAVQWGASLLGKSRVTNSSQYNHSMVIHTGSTPPKGGGAPPGITEERFRESLAGQKAKKQTPAERLADLRRITNA